jgi:hypothetical protein
MVAYSVARDNNKASTPAEKAGYEKQYGGSGKTATSKPRKPKAATAAKKPRKPKAAKKKAQ